jgi:hypothetical protein
MVDANVVISIMSGILVGALVFVFGLIYEPHEAAARKSMNLGAEDEEKFPTSLGGFIAQMKTRDAVMAKVVGVSSVRIVLAVYSVTVVVGSLAIWLTPITMRWWYFVLSLFAGYMILQGIFVLAKSGKIRQKPTQAAQVD